MPITPDIILVLAVLFLVVLFFIFEWVRVDMVGIMVMVCLPLLGLVTPQQAISGLSSNAVVSIIAVIIIGAWSDEQTSPINSQICRKGRKEDYFSGCSNCGRNIRVYAEYRRCCSVYACC